MCLFSCFILFSFVLADIWQKLKLLYQSAWSGTSPPSPYLTHFYLVLMLHIHILLSFHSRHVFESIIFNIEDNVWSRFGGDVYRFLSFYFVLFSCVKKKFKKKKIFCLAWSLCFEFVLLLLLKEFHCFHAQFITHARSQSNTTCCWRIKMIRKSWW